jgi:hypothetical protein
MDYKALEKNVIGVVSEQQIKLGYRSEVVRLYYPLSSLNNILRTDYTFMQMLTCLEEFGEYVRERMGRIEVTSDGERFCLVVSPQGSDYIHAYVEKNGFLREFIETIRKHGCTLQEILSVFKKYSKNVHAEKVNNGEFDYLIYFEDGSPDDYRYCLTMEENHMIYHRFSPADYEQLDL